MILDLSRPMTVVTMAGDTFECAASDPAEMDPAGLSVSVEALGEHIFIPWSNVATIRQPIRRGADRA